MAKNNRNVIPMCMYWCKCILRWCPLGPAVAFDWSMRLNDKYELDGRDENAAMGVAWCFGHHDRPFPSRPGFGVVRSMSRNGLESKFDMWRYRAVVSEQCVQAASQQPRLRALLPPAAFRTPRSSSGPKRALGGDIRGFFGGGARSSSAR